MKNREILPEDLINLFFLSLIGNLALAINLLFPLLSQTIKLALFLIFFTSYEWLIINFLVHYFVKYKISLIDHVYKNVKIYFGVIFVIGLIIYAVLIYNKSGIKDVVEKIIYIFVLLIGGYLIKTIGENIVKRGKEKRDISKTNFTLQTSLSHP